MKVLHFNRINRIGGILGGLKRKERGGGGERGGGRGGRRGERGGVHYLCRLLTTMNAKKYIEFFMCQERLAKFSLIKHTHTC